MLELLFADATRKGFLDARSARPPTVIVRPGAPNAAASSFASAVVREPLAGPPDDAAGQPRPAGGRDRRRHDRRVPCAPARDRRRRRSATAGRSTSRASWSRRGELLDALHALVDPATLAPVTVEVDPATEAIVRTWATDWRSSRADALGLPRDEDAAGDRARLPRRASADERPSATAALEACARQDGAELSYPFGEQAAVYKVAGKIFAVVGLDALAAAAHAQVRSRARRDAARASTPRSPRATT